MLTAIAGMIAKGSGCVNWFRPEIDRTTNALKALIVRTCAHTYGLLITDECTCGQQIVLYHICRGACARAQV